MLNHGVNLTLLQPLTGPVRWASLNVTYEHPASDIPEWLLLLFNTTILLLVALLQLNGKTHYYNRSYYFLRPIPYCNYCIIFKHTIMSEQKTRMLICQAIQAYSTTFFTEENVSQIKKRSDL